MGDRPVVSGVQIANYGANPPVQERWCKAAAAPSKKSDAFRAAGDP
jgi:hypothetical protein